MSFFIGFKRVAKVSLNDRRECVLPTAKQLNEDIAEDTLPDRVMVESSPLNAGPRVALVKHVVVAQENHEYSSAEIRKTVRYSSAEIIRDSTVSNPDVPCSAFGHQELVAHLSARVSLLVHPQNPNSASMVVQGRSGNVVYLSHLRSCVEEK